MVCSGERSPGVRELGVLGALALASLIAGCAGKDEDGGADKRPQQGQESGPGHDTGTTTNDDGAATNDTAGATDQTTGAPASCSPQHEWVPPSGTASSFADELEVEYSWPQGLRCVGDDWRFMVEEGLRSDGEQDEVLLQVWDVLTGVLIADLLMESEGEGGWSLTLTADTVGAACGDWRYAFTVYARGGEEQSFPEGYRDELYEYGRSMVRVGDQRIIELDFGGAADEVWAYVVYPHERSSSGPHLFSGVPGGDVWELTLEMSKLGLPSGSDATFNIIYGYCADGAVAGSAAW